MSSLPTIQSYFLPPLLLLAIFDVLADTQSVSTIGFEDGTDTTTSSNNTKNNSSNSNWIWNEKTRCPLMNMELLDVYNHSNSVDVQLGIAEDTVVQNIQFQSSKQLTSFVKCIKHMKLLFKQRAGRLAKEYAITTPQKKARKQERGVAAGASEKKKSKKKAKKKRGGGLFGFGLARRLRGDDGDESTDSEDIGDTTLPHLFGGPAARSRGGADEESGTAIDLLIEIVSANNLPVADIFSSDPYVVVRDGTKELHRTQVLEKK